MPRTPRALGAALLSAALLTSLTACGEDDGSAGTATSGSSSEASSTASSGAASSSAPADDAKVIDIAIKDGDVSPSGDRIEVKRGQTVELKVTADSEGEIHVHSDPEQELAYKEGEQTFSLAIERPGVVAVEDHALDKVIVQLEVR
ncbi:hypothetical protein [Nocardioides sp.]|uniref:hypothetical protein n=1 Tax=Nocardioides sp. TaxID=35761 RepID=UPI00351897A2